MQIERRETPLAPRESWHHAGERIPRTRPRSRLADRSARRRIRAGKSHCLTCLMPASVGFIVFIVSACHSEELTGQGVVAEAAQHAMRRLDDHPDVPAGEGHR